MASSSSPNAQRLTGLVVAGACLLPMGVLAQYKVVGPDGRVTYTDRPTSSAPLQRDSAPDSAPAPAPSPALPYELRTIAARYPVTLYAAPSCSACDAGRQLLRQRGIPYAERLVSDGDGELLQRLTGGRELPALTIGRQALRGFAADQWVAYLDAAGYPRQSRLPAGHPVPEAVPLDAGKLRAAPDAAAAGAPATTNSPEPAPAAPAPAGGIRF